MRAVAQRRFRLSWICGTFSSGTTTH
jgi:hypothetical protein